MLLFRSLSGQTQWYLLKCFKLLVSKYYVNANIAIYGCYFSQNSRHNLLRNVIKIYILLLNETKGCSQNITLFSEMVYKYYLIHPQGFKWKKVKGPPAGTLPKIPMYQLGLASMCKMEECFIIGNQQS